MGSDIVTNSCPTTLTRARVRAGCARRGTPGFDPREHEYFGTVGYLKSEVNVSFIMLGMEATATAHVTLVAHVNLRNTLRHLSPQTTNIHQIPIAIQPSAKLYQKHHRPRIQIIPHHHIPLPYSHRLIFGTTTQITLFILQLESRGLFVQ